VHIKISLWRAGRSWNAGAGPAALPAIPSIRVPLAHEQHLVLEHVQNRVRELQTAVVAIVRHFGIEDQVAAPQRTRLGEIRAKVEAPTERLIELYSAPPRS
jgi:hypothetical protein